MATETVPFDVDPPTRIYIEAVVFDVAHLTTLAQWLENASCIIDSVSAAALASHSVPFALDWEDEEESAGLCLLHTYIRQHACSLQPKPSAKA